MSFLFTKDVVFFFFFFLDSVGATRRVSLGSACFLTPPMRTTSPFLLCDAERLFLFLGLLPGLIPRFVPWRRRSSSTLMYELSSLLTLHERHQLSG